MAVSETTYDVIVLGAGINGCGIAYELSTRGQRVLVLDKGVIGGGTSSRSSRLIHGGLRYLENLHFGLVYEALHDRQELVARYPDLVRLRPFYLPVYRSSPRPTWMLWAGVKLYDLLAGRRNSGRSCRVPRAVFQQQFPIVKQDDIRAVLKYYDGKTDDWTLTRQVADETRALGGVFREHAAIEALSWTQAGFEVAVAGQRFCSPTLVNATGPWIDEVVQRFDLPARFQIRKVSGIHLFVDGVLVPEPMFLQTGGKRIFFVIPEPERNQTMIGTTEREEAKPVDEIEAQEADIAYLIQEVNAYLVLEAQLTPEDVKDVIIGVRPLVAKQADPTRLSREYELDLHMKGPSQLLNVFGGKLTTYLSLSRRAVKALRIRAPKPI